MHLLQRIIPILGMAGFVYWIGQHLRFIRLEHPLLLLLLLLLLPVAYLSLRLNSKQKQTLTSLIASHLWSRLNLNPGSIQTQSTELLKLLAFFCIIVALTRPQGPPVAAENQAQGLHILMAIDISDSSKATDLYPNRLEAAKQTIRELFTKLPQDNIGLAVFSGEAFSVAPFTQDKAALETLLSDVDTTLLPSRGTNIPSMITLAKERFSKIPQGGKLLIIFSDGENHEGDALKAVETLKAPDIRIFTVGTGTTAGSRIPEDIDDWGSMGFKQYQGQPVVTRLNEKLLKAIARAGGGTYTQVEKPQHLLHEIEKMRLKLPVSTSNTSIQTYEERFQWYLLLAILLLLLAHHLEKQPLHWQSPKPYILRWWSDFSQFLPRLIRYSAFLTLPILLQSAWTWPWEAFFKNQAGTQAYQQQDYSQSAKEFEAAIQAAPTEPRLYYNHGNALYQQKQYEQAIEAYRKALSLNGNPQEQSQIWYNLGNSYFQAGKQIANPEQSWNQALAAYQKALELNSKDQQARDNQTFVAQQLQKIKPSSLPNHSHKSLQPQSQKGKQAQPHSTTSSQNQHPSKAQQRSGTQPQTNQYSEEAIADFLQSLEEQERENRARKFFQRIPPRQSSGPEPDDLMTRPLEELEKMLQSSASNNKDW